MKRAIAICAISVGCLSLVVCAELASAVIDGNDPPNLDADSSCCVPEVELPPYFSTCENDDPFFNVNESGGYCMETKRPDGSYYCRTSAGSCTCAALGLTSFWDGAVCVGCVNSPHGAEPNSDKCCRVFRDLELTVYDGECAIGPGGTFMEWDMKCIGCVMTLTEPQPPILPSQKNVICCDDKRGGNCKICEPPPSVINP